MDEQAVGSSAEIENVSAQLPKTDMEAAALRPAITDLLQSVPTTWAEFETDKLSMLQANALFLLTAAGMVERRGWIRTTIANHPTCFELRFQATGEFGYCEALEHATVIEFETWSDAWRKWCDGESARSSPFHAQELKPQEWRLTQQGEIAREELNRAHSNEDLLTVVDFVIKRGLYGPGYWARRAIGAGQPITEDDQRIIARQLAEGKDLVELPRPPVRGEGRLLEIRKVNLAAPSQAVSLTNWPEGASAFADAFAKQLGPMFEAISRSAPEFKGEKQQSSDAQARTNNSPESLAFFCGGDMVFWPDRVTLCGVDICNGPRSRSRRVVLELLAQKRPDGAFVSYSGDDLEARAKEKGVEGTAGRWIKDLRRDIKKLLLTQASIEVGPQDVILSGGPGYRLAASVSVQFRDPSMLSHITEADGASDVPNDDGRDVFDVVDDAAAVRRAWILQELGKERQLKAPDVAEHFSCSVKTSQRDLTALKDEGRIEFVGAPRTGFYRLRQSASP